MKVRLRVDSKREIQGSNLATIQSFPFKQPKLMPAQFAMMNAALIEDAADFRRTGSAVL